MSLDNRTAQEKLTLEERRGLLRAFADRMLLKVTAMDDPEDLPGVEKAMRVAAVIERVYSRCDRAERQKHDKTPDPRKLEAERALNESDAIKARVSLANTLKWGEERRRDLGPWWDAAQDATQNAAKTDTHPVEQTSTPVQPQPMPLAQTATAPESPASFANRAASASGPKVTYVDLTEDIEAARAELALKQREAAKSTRTPDPPLRGPPSE